MLNNDDWPLDTEDYERLCYGERDEDEDYWLGEDDLTKVIR